MCLSSSVPFCDNTTADEKPAVTLSKGSFKSPRQSTVVKKASLQKDIAMKKALVTIATLLTLTAVILAFKIILMPHTEANPDAESEAGTLPPGPADPDTGRDPVTALTCLSPASLDTLLPLSGSRAVISAADYERHQTTLYLVDIAEDAVVREITLEGIWNLHSRHLADNRLALCCRETNTWRFLNAFLEDEGTFEAVNADGVFSFDGSVYYYLEDRQLYSQRVNGGNPVRESLPLDLRLSELTACDAERGVLVMTFYLSPYSAACGTAVYDMTAHTLTMLSRNFYQITFDGEAAVLLSFDNEAMGYDVLYSAGSRCLLADAGLFPDEAGSLYAIAGSPYLMGIAAGGSTLYECGETLSAASLADAGIAGDMYTACYLPEDARLLGAVYRDGAFRLYAVDPNGLAMAVRAQPAETDSPMTLDTSLTEAYWHQASDAPVPASLAEARRYADRLEDTYGISILLSSQCAEAAAQCDMTVTLTDKLTPEEELQGTSAMLAALDRTLALYPDGFPSQFRNSSGDGGLCFFPVSAIESPTDTVGCTYERFDWQFIALDVTTGYSLDSIICHEMWHATENHIFSLDYMALPMDVWDAENPAGFTYTGDAARTDPSQPWILYAGLPEDIYFVDSYACVSRQEDRARIMEYLMTREDEAAILLQSPHIRRKLALMNEAVRRAFDTAGWDRVRWENLS